MNLQLRTIKHNVILRRTKHYMD